MRIGYLLQSPKLDLSRPSGPQIHVTRIVDGLRARGHHVRLIQQTAEGVRWSDGDGWHDQPFPTRWRPRLRLVERPVRLLQTLLPIPYFNYFDSLRFADLADGLLADCDLLYERYEFMAWGGSLLSQRRNLPHLLEVNGSHFDELALTDQAPRGLQRHVSRWISRRTFDRASHVLPSGTGWQRRLTEIGLLRNPNTTVVWPGTDPDLFRPKMADTRPRSGAPTITFLGNFDAWQGVGWLLDAFDQLQHDVPDARLLLIGSGRLWEQYREQIADLPYRDQITLTGRLPQPDVAAALAESDIAVQLYTDWFEFAGMKLFDYMASGSAVVVAVPNGEHDLIEDGVNGVLIGDSDSDELPKVLLQLAQQPDYCAELGRAARATILNHHSWDHRVATVESLAQQHLTQSHA